MRVVSLACSNTEIVCALGCADLLVGVDDHSDYPEEVVATLPRVGPDLSIDVAKVAALKPDLVLASLTVPGHEKNIEALEQAGLPFLAPEPISVRDVYRDVYDIAKALGVEDRATPIVEQMKKHFATPPLGEGRQPKLLVQWWPKPVIAPGKQSWVHDLIHWAGGTHPLAEEEVKSRPMTDDEVLDAAPDAMIISWCGVKTEKYRPEVIYRNERWQALPAIKERRVFCVPEAFLGRPSPRLLDGYKALRQIIEALRSSQRDESIK